VAVVGLDNLVVVNTKDGILVARKDMSQQIGEVSKRVFHKE
jgi:Mannose-6-phosphate isomerase